eukprot:CAMPEP_0185380736 /NCGR_PEP_ID=MMETSP1364-20130426/51020_1 /TAXON_ID=38817 /ORGANISM="Gephyrocapsa oceanica, Strain RCC1303" /LENGTH=94 /DNA_ID=CAMNT_0027982377 /DNA_START=231 /DNA_END=515 /DNA_ORIENTATION=+
MPFCEVQTSPASERRGKPCDHIVAFNITASSSMRSPTSTSIGIAVFLPTTTSDLLTRVTRPSTSGPPQSRQVRESGVPIPTCRVDSMSALAAPL